MTMTTFLLNSLGHDRPRSDPCSLRRALWCRVASIASVPSVLQDASLFFLALFF